jgi:hypothetical protein
MSFQKLVPPLISQMREDPKDKMNELGTANLAKLISSD